MRTSFDISQSILTCRSFAHFVPVRLKTLPLVCVASIFLLCCQPTIAEDWPTWRHDARRSGATIESLDFSRVHLSWSHRPRYAPMPAWPGPARWDAYVKRPLIASMRNYDESFHVTVADGAVYFGSSADNSVHCLDLKTGNERWAYATGGAVRHPPTIDGGRLYFGSDDGCVYCLDANSQKLRWKFRPAPAEYVLHDCRAISTQPIRTGVVVQDGKVYFGASLLPWEKSYLCCVNAETGQPDAPGTYVQTLEGATLEGSILAADDHLIVTQGRSAPLWATRATGASRGTIPGVHGGSFALVTEDGTRLVGPGPREGFFSEADQAHKTTVARKFGAIAMVAQGGLLYVLERNTLGCFRQQPEEWVWRKPCDLADSFILAGDKIIAGGADKLMAFRNSDGTAVWQTNVQGRVQGLAVADKTLLVSTDEGLIYTFSETDDSNLSAEAAAKPIDYRPIVSPLSEPLPTTAVPPEITLGPIVRFPTRGDAVITWTTAQPQPTTLVNGNDATITRYHSPQPVTEHTVRMSGLKHNTVYRWSLVLDDGAEGQVVGPFECDTHMDMSPPRVGYRPVAKSSSVAIKPLNIELVPTFRHGDRGLCLIVGADAAQWSMATGMRVIIMDDNAAQLAQLRAQFQKDGLLGTRIDVVEVADIQQLPITDHIANLVVVSPALAKRFGNNRVTSLLHKAVPQTGKLLVADQPPTNMLAAPALADTGDWSHQYGRADNATFADECLQGACHTSDFRVQWLGRPGPRFQSDRGNRKPAPLFAGGRLLVQGLDRLMALDAYNGTVLWNREVPDSRRFNIRNDSANWCADDDHVYLAVRNGCWQIDATTGEVRQVFRADDNANNHWGYVCRLGERLVGTSVPAGSAFQEFWGGQYWYTDSAGPLAAKVCSRRLFAYDLAGNQLAWEYTGGTIVHTSITLDDNRVLFVECRNPEVAQLGGGRIESPKLWQDLQLVALSLTDGKLLWRQPLDVGAATTMFSLASGNGHVVAVASRKSDYHVEVRELATGKPLWHTVFDWEAIGKGGDSARPVIIDNTLYVSPRAFNLATGKELPQKLTRGACGSYAAAKNVFITRLGNLGLWDPQAGKASGWQNLRPDCWLSAIPAGGLILAPEGGGGCSCGGWIETSIAFSPNPAK